MNAPLKILYTGRTHVSGGRDGTARSEDGRLDILLSLPGARGNGTNPEQLLAAGWSACFLGAIGQAAHLHHMAIPRDASVDAEIDLGFGDSGFELVARLTVHLPGVDRELAQTLIEQAHATCPYSKAMHGNIDASFTLA